MMASMAVFIPPRLENLSIGLGGLLGFAVIATPLVFVANLPGGNWVELQPERLRIKHWWFSGLNVPYSEITDVKGASRHNPILAFLYSKSMVPFEEHVDLVVRFASLGAVWGRGRWASFGNAIHISPNDPDSFVTALTLRLQEPRSES
jgi:hypothetical protein